MRTSPPLQKSNGFSMEARPVARTVSDRSGDARQSRRKRAAKFFSQL
jgi:hypothetical protein